MAQMNKSAYEISMPVISEQKKFLSKNKENFPNQITKQFFPLIEMNMSEAGSMLVSSDEAEIFTSGKAFFDDLCEQLESAKNSIFMEYFIFHEDQIGKRIMEILCRKAKEGVNVKLIYDDLGSLKTRTRFFRQLNICGGRARPFFQIRIGLPLTLNYRNHRKTTIIDSSVAYIGGMNIGDEYANQKKNGKLNWRDTTVRLKGGSAINLQSIFLLDWYSLDAWQQHTKTLEETKTYFPAPILNKFFTDSAQVGKDLVLEMSKENKIPTQIVTCGPNNAKKANIEDALIRMIMSAKKNVYIQTPYFTPNDEFRMALKLASYSGVDVKIIIPGDWDKFYMKAASSEFVRETLAQGVRFYLYNGFIHSKMITVDGKISSIGTTNIDIRSFSLHFEENAFFYDETFTARCEEIFENDLKSAREVFKSDYDKQFIVKRAFWSFCKLFSPLM